MLYSLDTYLPNVFHIWPSNKWGLPMKLFLVKAYINNVPCLFSNEGEWIPEEGHFLKDLFILQIYDAAQTLMDTLSQHMSEELEIVDFDIPLHTYLELLGVRDEIQTFFSEFDATLCFERRSRVKRKMTTVERRKAQIHRRTQRMMAKLPR